MKYRNPKTGKFEDVIVKVTDTLPVGSIVDYEGESIPEGWELVSENGSIKTIKKIENKLAVPGIPLNEKTTSNKDTYSCDYLNTYLTKLDKAINGLEGELLYINFNYENGVAENFEIPISKLSEYARIDITFIRAADFHETNGIYTTFEIPNERVVATLYPYANFVVANYVDYYNNAPRVFERAVHAAVDSNKLIVTKGLVNGQINNYVMVPHFIIGYKGSIVG